MCVQTQRLKKEEIDLKIIRKIIQIADLALVQAVTKDRVKPNVTRRTWLGGVVCMLMNICQGPERRGHGGGNRGYDLGSSA
jgi:hypothetical protein